jgi:hypothetical protein
MGYRLLKTDRKMARKVRDGTAQQGEGERSSGSTDN